MRLWTILAGLAGLFYGLLANAPAAKLVPHILGPDSGIRTYELSGTLVEGRIGALQAGTIQVQDLNWILHPASLLTGAVSADIDAALGGVSAQGRVRHSLGGATTVTDLQATGAVADLKPLLKLPFLPVDGQISAQFERVRLEGRIPVEAQGLVRLGNVEWTLTKPPGALGDFAAEVTTDEDDNIVASVDDSQAAIAIDGGLTLAPDGSYAVQAKLRPKANTPAPVANNLKALGRTDREGWYSLKYSGQLKR